MNSDRFYRFIPNLLLAFLLSSWLTHFDTGIVSVSLFVLFFLVITWFSHAYFFILLILFCDLVQRLYLGYAGKEKPKEDWG